MMQPPSKQIAPIVTAAALIPDTVNTLQSVGTKQQQQQQQPHQQSSHLMMNNTSMPCQSTVQTLIDINTAGVAFLQSGSYIQALGMFQRGLAVYGVDLTKFGVPSSCTKQQQEQQQQEEIRELPKLTVSNSSCTSLLCLVDLRSVQSASPMEQDHTTPFELYARGLLLKKSDNDTINNEEAQFLLPAVLLYNAAVLVHLRAVGTRDHYMAHELYRCSLFFMEEAILHKRCSEQQYLQSDLLLLALFNNLCQLNSLFYLPERVALCREKLIQVLVHTHPAHVGVQDYVFFYEQLIFSANIFPAAAAAA